LINGALAEAERLRAEPFFVMWIRGDDEQPFFELVKLHWQRLLPVLAAPRNEINDFAYLLDSS
jgi:hypothetical protein